MINLSLGSTFDSRAVETAADYASSQGVVVVASVGNSDREQPVEYPAALDPTISVAAVSPDGGKASFSNYHDTVDISAPGSEVASAYPGGRYATASGTSLSAAVVTGGVALLLERQPEIGPDGVMEILTSASGPLQLDDPTLAGKLGAGEIDIDASIACEG